MHFRGHKHSDHSRNAYKVMLAETQMLSLAYSTFLDHSYTWIFLHLEKVEHCIHNPLTLLDIKFCKESCNLGWFLFPKGQWFSPHVIKSHSWWERWDIFFLKRQIEIVKLLLESTKFQKNLLFIKWVFVLHILRREFQEGNRWEVFF